MICWLCKGRGHIRALYWINGANLMQTYPCRACGGSGCARGLS